MTYEKIDLWAEVKRVAAGKPTTVDQAALIRLIADQRLDDCELTRLPVPNRSGLFLVEKAPRSI
jgi:hypothetical protein